MGSGTKTTATLDSAPRPSGRGLVSLALLALLASSSGCPESGTGDRPCTPGATRMRANACGVCGSGSRVELCDERQAWVPRECIDPFDGDGDTYANQACAGLVGGCCTSKLDCNDEDPELHPDPLECLVGETERCTTACGTSGERTCGDACTWDECVASGDGCNGVDDDCDGETDEDVACAPGTETACLTVCGTTGVGTCTADCLSPIGIDCAPPDEICNRLDDDCNGTTDDGFPCPALSRIDCTTSCGSTGHGVCSIDCELPAVADCTPPLEACANGEDDDCDGQTDELDPGQCVAGTLVDCTTTCGSTGSGTCSAACRPPADWECTPPVETCNGEDDDCDGGTDEDFACVAGTEVDCATSCGTTGRGMCSAACALPGVAACVPPAERCGDGVDDDCDGLTDEACPANDTCAAPAALLLGGTMEGSTAGAAGDYVPSGGCAVGDGRDVVFAFALAEPSDVFLTTAGSTFDTLLYAGRTCGQSDLGCNDDHLAGPAEWSVLSLPALDVGTAWVVLDGPTATDAGDYRLTAYATTPPSPEGDRCGRPAMFSGTAGSMITDLCLFSADDSATCGGLGNDAVLYFVVNTPGTYEFDTCNAGTTLDTILSLRSSCDDVATELACADDDAACAGNPGASRLTLTLPVGAYFLGVDSKYSGCGSVQIDVSRP
jgi:hypothetical protein